MPRLTIPRTAIALALTTVGCAFASCGKGQYEVVTRSTATAATTAHTTQQPQGHRKGGPTAGHTARTRARAFVRAVSLRASDVPGFHVSTQRESSDKNEKQLEHELVRCVGATGSSEKDLAAASSPNFERKEGLAEGSVSSQVSVARTAATAAAGLKAYRSSHTRRCFSHYLDLLFKGKSIPHATIGAVSIAQGTPPAPGVTGSFAWRITAEITVQVNAHPLQLHFYLDLLGFVYGRTSVSLYSSGFPAPFPAAAEQHLYLLLLARAKAAHSALTG